MHHQAVIDIYRGKNPGDIPIYFSLRGLRHSFRLPVATIRAWSIGRKYTARSGAAAFLPLINSADPDRLLLSFRNLGDLHVLGSI